MATVERFEDLVVWQEAREIEYLKNTPFEGPKFHESGPVWHINEPKT